MHSSLLACLFAGGRLEWMSPCVLLVGGGGVMVGSASSWAWAILLRHSNCIYGDVAGALTYIMHQLPGFKHTKGQDKASWAPVFPKSASLCLAK